ncbi:hypothetical protein PLANPX_0692 [Lacipirellula parvula]|uniref:Uncharacterized protein n=1 Tax=Lacipirellula parvula TaxID=2650471 RepID=A0A5K7X3J1_9BACT|nr:hypothetical protein PLANPX_0692 [Lacipirellula parvula]
MVRHVLNACRRQRISHPDGTIWNKRLKAVLNACRRQRISHAGYIFGN